MNTMKKTFVLLFCALFASAAGAEYVDRARVIEATPVVETVFETERVCRNETRRARPEGEIERKVVGGVLGGLAGSAFGKGGGRDAAAGAGAVLGSELADSDGISEGEIIGGLAGGIIGNQVGKGSGKTAGTAAGALLGAIVGDELQNGASRTGKKVRVCEDEERAKKIITGYDVVYEHNGIRGTGRLPYRPGDYVDVNVRVDLLENRTGLSE